MDFKLNVFMQRLNMFRRYEEINGNICLVIVDKNGDILYQQGYMKLDNELNDLMVNSRERISYQVKKSTNGKYSLCYPIIRKNKESYNNNGFIIILNLQSKDKMEDFLLFCELLSFIVGSNIYLDDIFEEMPTNMRKCEISTLLTKKEYEVAKRISIGLPDTLICDKLFKSRSTLRVHLKNMFEKLGVENRTQVACYYYMDKINEHKKNMMGSAI